MGAYILGTNDQRQLSRVKSFESPTKTNESSKRFTTYVSCVQTSLSNSWKFQERDVQRSTDSEGERFESKAAAEKIGTALPLQFSDSKNNEIKKVAVENSSMKDMSSDGLVPNAALKDGSKESTAVKGQYFDENLESQQEGSDRKTNRIMPGSQVRIQETPQNKRINFNCSKTKAVYCHNCSLSVNPTSEKKASIENEQKNCNINIHANSSGKCLRRRTLSDTVTIQALCPIRSLTFSTPGKNSDGNFSRAKKSLASVSVQKKNNWRSMSLTSEVPIIIISSVDE